MIENSMLSGITCNSFKWTAVLLWWYFHTVVFYYSPHNPTVLLNSWKWSVWFILTNTSCKAKKIGLKLLRPDSECCYLSIKSSFANKNSHIFDIFKDLSHLPQRQRRPAGLQVTEQNKAGWVINAGKLEVLLYTMQHVRYKSKQGLEKVLHVTKPLLQIQPKLSFDCKYKFNNSVQKWNWNG